MRSIVRRWRRWRRPAIERAALGELGARDAQRLFGRLRDEPGLRRAFDRSMLAMRVLEHAEVAQAEIDLVEQWLTADGVLGPAASPRLRAWPLALAATMAAAAAVWLLRPPAPPQPDDGFGVKGGADARHLGLQLLCDDDRRAPPSVDDRGGHCPLGGTLAFAIRVAGMHRGGEALVVFGVDDRGDVQYYVPTPDAPAQTVVPWPRDTWQPLTRAVTLSVNHHAGVVRVYAALLPSAPSLAAIDEAAAALSRSSANEEDRPWSERLPPDATLLRGCDGWRCAFATSELVIDGEPR